MIVSNVAIPLVGLVDVAIVGNISDAAGLAGVSLGALIITQVIWLCGFLRMSTTGYSAQAKGAKDSQKSQMVLQQSLSVALIIGVALVLLQGPMFQLGAWFADASLATRHAASTYYDVRIWSAPFALANLVYVGWLLGQQQHRYVMRWQIAASIANIVLSYVMAIPFEMGIFGVAIATVFSEVLLFLLCSHSVAKAGYKPFWVGKAETEAFKNMLNSHQHMLLRNILLQGCIAFITYSGLRLGADIGAVNAILMQFFVMIALGLDGLAYAIESLVGEAHGKKANKELHNWVKLGLLWSAFVACIYSLIFYWLGRDILELLTNIAEIRVLASDFMIYIVVLPLFAHWCFLFDGIFIGLSWAKKMRDTMFLSALLGLFPVWYLTRTLENDGLWVSFLVFLLMRGVTMGWHYSSQKHIW